MNRWYSGGVDGAGWGTLAWGDEGAGEVGSYRGEMLPTLAGEVGSGEVGSKSGDPVVVPAWGMVVGDRLRWWRVLVAPMGDVAVGPRGECSRVLEGALMGGGDRLLRERPESVELTLDGDA